jgi:hypothetical protein
MSWEVLARAGAEILEDCRVSDSALAARHAQHFWQHYQIEERGLSSACETAV